MQMKLYGFTKFRNPYANTLLHKVAMENTNDHVPRSTAPAPATMFHVQLPPPPLAPLLPRSRASSANLALRRLEAPASDRWGWIKTYKNVGTTWQNGTSILIGNQRLLGVENRKCQVFDSHPDWQRVWKCVALSLKKIF